MIFLDLLVPETKVPKSLSDRNDRAVLCSAEKTQCYSWACHHHLLQFHRAPHPHLLLSQQALETQVTLTDDGNRKQEYMPASNATSANEIGLFRDHGCTTRCTRNKQEVTTSCALQQLEQELDKGEEWRQVSSCCLDLIQTRPCATSRQAKLRQLQHQLALVCLRQPCSDQSCVLDELRAIVPSVGSIRVNHQIATQHEPAP